MSMAVIILTTVALCGATAGTSLLLGDRPPCGAPGRVRPFASSPGSRRATGSSARRPTSSGARSCGASVLGPALAFAFAMMAAVSTAESSVVEFTLAQVAVWVVVAVCAICLSALGSEASIIVVAATAPLVVAFLARGADLTISLAALIDCRRLLRRPHARRELSHVRGDRPLAFRHRRKAARRRRSEAGGDDHRPDRRSDRLSPTGAAFRACSPTGSGREPRPPDRSRWA